MDSWRLAGKTRSLFFDPIPELGTRKWKLETRKIENRSTGLGDGRGLDELRVSNFEFRGTKPHEATGPKMLIVKEIGQKWKERSQCSYRTCYQWLAAILGSILEKLGPMKWVSILPIWAAGATEPQPNGTKWLVAGDEWRARKLSRTEKNSGICITARPLAATKMGRSD